MKKQERKPYVRPIIRVAGWKEMKSWAKSLITDVSESTPDPNENEGRDWISYLEADSINQPWWEIYSESNGLDVTEENIRDFYQWLEHLEENQEKPELP